MKHIALVLSLIAALLPSTLQAFTVKNSDGVEIYYNVISEKDKTVEVTGWQ